jgi:hypothetical protein
VEEVSRHFGEILWRKLRIGLKWATNRGEVKSCVVARAVPTLDQKETFVVKKKKMQEESDGFSRFYDGREQMSHSRALLQNCGTLDVKLLSVEITIATLHNIYNGPVV